MGNSESVVEDVEDEDEVDGLCIREVEINLELQKGIDDLMNKNIDTRESVVKAVEHENDLECDGLCVREPVKINLEPQKGNDDLEDDKKADDSIKPQSKNPLFSEKSLEAIDDMIVQDVSELKLHNYDDVDTDKRKTTDINGDRIVERISAQEGNERRSDSLKSEIFVKHKLEDTPKGDPLGGFLETVPLKDGFESMLHSFCNVDENGILYEHLQIRDGQYLLSLNGQEISGWTSVNHEEVIHMFSTLPVDKENAMIVYDPKKKQTLNITFVLSGTKGKIIKTVFEPLEYLPFGQWRKTEIVAIKLTHKDLFLTCGEDGKLHVTSSTDWKSNHCCHFEHWTKYEVHGKLESLSVYKHEKMDVFLGLDGNVVELVKGELQHTNVQFLTNIRNSGFVIRPASNRGMVLCYDECSALKLASEKERFGIEFQKPEVHCK